MKITHVTLLTVLLVSSNSILAFDEVRITPNTPLGWESANLRDDAIVEINDNQPLFGGGSLMFATDTVTSGQDKGDFQFIWQQSIDAIDFPDRILGNISELSYFWYRDANSTTAAHFTPVVRLSFYDDAGTPQDFNDDKTGFLIWEGIYNGINPAATDSWQLSDIINGNFWAFVSGEGVVADFDVTLDDWVTGNHPNGSLSLSTNTNIIGLNIGVGSGWNNSFIGYVDAVRLSFGEVDDVLYNFELCDLFVPNTNPDVIFDNSFECFQ